MGLGFVNKNGLGITCGVCDGNKGEGFNWIFYQPTSQD